jgi:hypothetical protein
MEGERIIMEEVAAVVVDRDMMRFPGGLLVAGRGRCRMGIRGMVLVEVEGTTIVKSHPIRLRT